MALGSLIIKQILGCSDEELICQVAENPYLQFFIGLKEFSEECPFGASTLVAFRRSFTEKDIAKINDLILGRARDRADGGDGSDDDGGDGGEKTMALDATVAPSDIAYPQDIKLLNDAREHLEAIIDSICEQTGSPKPRMYRRTARKDFPGCFFVPILWGLDFTVERHNPAFARMEASRSDEISVGYGVSPN